MDDYRDPEADRRALAIELPLSKCTCEEMGVRPGVCDYDIELEQRGDSLERSNRMRRPTRR